MKRREFLRNAICAGLGGAGLYSAFGNLQLMHAATRAYGPAAFSDYKALVCVFLHGGNDGFNTVVPHSDAAYNQYRTARATLALPRDQLLPLLPQAGGGASDGANYALYAATGEGNPVGASGLRDLFNSGKAAILANVGTLMRPTTKAQYHSGSHALPPLLFSHDAQQNYWQISRTDDLRNLGWGGRIADLLHDANPGGFIPMLTGLGGESLLGRAAVATQFVTGTGGPNVFSHTAWNAERRAVMNEIMKPAEQKHPMERAYAAAYTRTRDTAASVRDALEATPELATVFPDTGLGMQLRMVAQLIAARNILGMKRQIYFVGVGGFDTHDFQMSSHAGLLSMVGQAITAFQRATTELGVDNGVTTFTASDFGRTLSSNGDGSDHGWGSHHLVVGGAVNGGRFYGRMPQLQNGSPEDVGWGQIIPTTSVDQYAATLARWFGVADSELNLILPNLANFEQRNLGFMKA